MNTIHDNQKIIDDEKQKEIAIAEEKAKNLAEEQAKAEGVAQNAETE